MKRVQMFLAGAFIAVGSLYAQTPASEWKAGVAKLKETIQANPAQAAEEAEQMIKGKNKKNIELLVAIGEAYLYYGNYPLARPIYAILNDPRNGLPWGFTSFMTSDKGQRIILKSGLVPATQPIRVVHVNDE